MDWGFSETKRFTQTLPKLSLTYLSLLLVDNLLKVLAQGRTLFFLFGSINYFSKKNGTTDNATPDITKRITKEYLGSVVSLPDSSVIYPGKL